jgi:ArsR family transcriptional regulator, arsenate/arsenite/antimonite-responsive transcriptional repressor
MNAQQTIDALQALAQEHRLAAFRLLVEAGPPGIAAGEIARALGVAPATLSFHLNQLGQAGLVQSRREGRSIIYAANFDAMDGLVGFLMQNCCRGSGESCPPLTVLNKRNQIEETDR